MQARAISPVIATLLLILIALAAAVLIYVWVTGYVTGLTKAGTPELEEKIKIEAVSASTDTVTLYIRNVGGTSVVIDAIYIIRVEDNSIITVASSTTSLNPGDLTSITISGGFNLESGKTYIVKVVTKSGVETATSFKVIG